MGLICTQCGHQQHSSTSVLTLQGFGHLLSVSVGRPHCGRQHVHHSPAAVHCAGSIASFRQQAGRAGRREQQSMSIYVAFDGPLDQYFMTYPRQLFDRPIEAAHVGPHPVFRLPVHPERLPDLVVAPQKQVARCSGMLWLDSGIVHDLWSTAIQYKFCSFRHIAYQGICHMQGRVRLIAQG